MIKIILCEYIDFYISENILFAFFLLKNHILRNPSCFTFFKNVIFLNGILKYEFIAVYSDFINITIFVILN